MNTKKDIIAVLKTIPDPELNISLWDLGLIYSVLVDKKGHATITMTLTSMGCPLFSIMQKEIEEKIQAVKGVKSVHIDLTFDPLWTIQKMSKHARTTLGM